MPFEAQKGRRGKTPLNLNLGIIWSWVTNIKAPTALPPGETWKKWSSCLYTYRASTCSVTTLTNSCTHYTKFMDAKITLKIHIKSQKNNPDMFRNTKETSSGGEQLCLAKVTCGSVVQVHVDSVSIVAAYISCCVCVRVAQRHYTAWVVDEWMSMEQWWNDTDRRKLKYWEKNIIQRGW